MLVAPGDYRNPLEGPLVKRYDSLSRGPRVAIDRSGLSADKVLRAPIVKRLYSYGYEDLSFHLADSEANRRFCHFASTQAVRTGEELGRKSTVARGIKQIMDQTWAEINRIPLGYASDGGTEDGKWVRIDPTVTDRRAKDLAVPSSDRQQAALRLYAGV